MINEKHCHIEGAEDPKIISKRAGSYKIVKINRKPIYAKVYIKEEFDMKDALIKKQKRAFEKRFDKQKMVDTYKASMLIKTNYEKDIVSDVKDDSYGYLTVPIDLENKVTDLFKSQKIKNVGLCCLEDHWNGEQVVFIMEKDKIKDEYNENVDSKEITDSVYSVFEGCIAQPLNFCDCKNSKKCKHDLNPYSGNDSIIMDGIELKETLNIEHIDTESETEEYSNDEEEYKPDECLSFSEKHKIDEEEEYESDEQKD